jgi:hypothetical protein
MENASGTGPSQAADSSGAASTKDGLSLNQLDDLLRRLGDRVARPMREDDQSMRRIRCCPLVLHSYWVLRSADSRKEVSRD